MLPESQIVVLMVIALLHCSPSGTTFDYCNEAQCPQGKTHSMCGGCSTASNVKAIPATVAFRTAILDEHNKIRDLVASGKNTSIGLPSASNMRALSYDMDLEYTVTCWLHRTGAMQHDECRTTEKFHTAGQNLMMSSYFAASSDEAHREAPRRWMWDEVKYALPAHLQPFTGTMGQGGSIGHLTQELWALSTHIGCAICYMDEPTRKMYLVGCNYGPAGNVIPEPVYLQGAPASSCPEGTRANTKFINLCGNIEPIPSFQSNKFVDIRANGVKSLFLPVLFIILY